ncbi:hypothetical protein K7X08_024927 [Anisodus acutangulus]|uniref:Uncharacterized protein n=1 Tax=Anisodus acutangulus TaxID=402998 RepID=A0A9Q1MBU3_9SOLA|nr:hypothetical protein K7X08_024927 [Anisodus acutangulus]
MVSSDQASFPPNLETKLLLHIVSTVGIHRVTELELRAQLGKGVKDGDREIMADEMYARTTILSANLARNDCSTAII